VRRQKRPDALGRDVGRTAVRRAFSLAGIARTRFVANPIRSGDERLRDARTRILLGPKQHDGADTWLRKVDR